MILDIKTVERELVSSIDEIKKKFKLDHTINGDFIPGACGIQSQILLTVMGRIATRLDIHIPDNCYIFHDRNNRQQLSIRGAAKKLLTVVKNGK
ncbi:MAG: hypothetical protein RLN88_11355 [Ekhidna sp.]|uniref:hypothetical protein n=1 Tax=Ekhidna sp. TaxID=2608089 RepID=UPI0032EE120E